MVLGVSDAVVEVIDTMYFLKSAMRLDLINYSALARIIKPLVEEKVGGEVELETIIMAIRRNVHVFTRQAAPSIFQILKDTKVELKTGVAFVKIKNRPGIYEQVIDVVKDLNREQAENSYVVQRVDEISIILPEELLKKIEQLPAVKKEKEAVEVRTELAMITIHMPTAHLDVPGIYGLVTTQLADLGIALAAIVSSFTRVSLVCKEEDAPMAYEKINKLIHESKTIARMKL